MRKGGSKRRKEGEGEEWEGGRRKTGGDQNSPYTSTLLNSSSALPIARTLSVGRILKSSSSSSSGAFGAEECESIHKRMRKGDRQ